MHPISYKLTTAGVRTDLLLKTCGYVNKTGDEFCDFQGTNTVGAKTLGREEVVSRTFFLKKFKLQKLDFVLYTHPQIFSK